MVVALVLAALVNADALVERAERKPLGPGRDRSLAIWHPVQDIAHVTQISRLRDLGDWLVGNEDEGGRGVPVGPGPPTTVPPDAVRPDAAGARPPDEPLRVYIGGDSIIRDAGDAFLNLASDSPLFDTTLHYENATGLTRPDFYDWPAALADDMDGAPARGGVHPVRRQRLPGHHRPERRGVRRAERPALAGGVRPPGGGRDGHPARRRPHRVLGRPARRCATTASTAAPRS